MWHGGYIERHGAPRFSICGTDVRRNTLKERTVTVVKFTKANPGKNEKSTEKTVANKTAILLMKKRMHQQLLSMALCLLVVSIASFALITRAWFAMNRTVTGNDNTITSDTPSASLYIRDASDLTTAYASEVTKSASGSLFPSSTADLTNWYYASAFSYTPRTVTGSGYTYTVNDPTATAYTLISSFTDAAAGTYTNAYENATKVAYYKSSNNLYTTQDSLDVYLDHTNPITVSYDTSNAIVQKQLLNALRVGIYTGGAMKLIYAPLAESGTGNSSGASADTFYYISSGSLTNASSVVKTTSTLTPFLASPSLANDQIYTPDSGSPTPICTATTAGVNVDVYVWLEGTDAQALVGLSDNDLKGINVSIKYVGVEPSP